MAIQGLLSVALDDDTLVADPTWHRLDVDYQVQLVEIDRGRAYEFDRTDAGTARVSILDLDGSFDPTNTGGTFYGRLEPLKQAAVALQNPTDSSYSTIFRGFIESIEYVPAQNEEFATVELRLVDGMAIVAAAELTAGGGFGTVPYNAGDVYYPAGTVTTAVQTRINQVLDEVGWPSGTLLRQIFTGNVTLQETTYANRTSALTAIQDASDAEFPGVANVYCNAAGKFTFHGRFARFNPSSVSSGTDWDYTAWECGDQTAADLDPTNVAVVSTPLSVFRDVENLFTDAIATPQGIDDADVDGQYVASGAVSSYGLRTWSAENLLTLGGSLSGTATTALEECLKFASYYTGNYATPRTRVAPLTFRPQPGVNQAASWNLFCGVDISDRITVTTTHNGGGGFNDQFVVEGVRYRIAQPTGDGNPDVTLELDVSPVGYYSDNPFD